MKAGAGSLSPAAAQADCAGAQQRAAQGQQGQGVVGRHGGHVAGCGQTGGGDVDPGEQGVGRGPVVGEKAHAIRVARGRGRG